MKNLILSLIFCLSHLSLNAQDNVIIGKYKKFESKLLGGEITYLEHLPEGYEKSDKSYPVIFTMNGQNISQARDSRVISGFRKGLWVSI